MDQRLGSLDIGALVKGAVLGEVPGLDDVDTEVASPVVPFPDGKKKEEAQSGENKEECRMTAKKCFHRDSFSVTI
jgi:hypothetical protein